MNDSLRALGKTNILSIKSIEGDVKLALAVSNQWVSIGLFKRDGSYDQSRLLVSNRKEAIKWSNNIFNSYDKKAKEIDLTALK